MKLTFILLAVAFCAGCVNFNTNVDRAAIPAFSRILVVSKLPNINANYLTPFISGFPTQYATCVVNAGPLALENPDTLINQKAQRCDSEVILTISFLRNYTEGSGKSATGYDEILYEMAPVATRKPFWKSIATSHGTQVYPSRIIKQLQTDGVITGKIPEPKATY